MKQTVVVSETSQQDLKALQHIARETFFETFAASNTEADMKKYLEENFSDAKMRAELSNPGSVFCLAWDNEIPVGYLKVNSGQAQTELMGGAALEIERIYVKGAYHGKKVGQLLYEKALEIAQIKEITYLWLGVWEKNPKAIRFYEKNGFVAFDKHIFKLGQDEQTDIMMKKVL